MSPIDYVAVTFKLTAPLDANADIVCAMLEPLGCEGFHVEDDTINAYFLASQIDQDALQELTTRFFELGLIQKNENVQEQIAPTNWNETWEKNYFKPIVVKDKLYIRGSFHEPRPEIEKEIIIDPKMSFGTGHHQTTHMMLQAMIALDLKNKAVVDMGTGTGILALYAALEQAAPIVAIDIDDWSVENTIENCSLNKLDGAITVMKGDERTLAKLDMRFDVFLANINLWVLLSNVENYCLYIKPGGTLLLSGFLLADKPALVDIMGREPNKVLQEGDWLMLQFDF